MGRRKLAEIKVEMDAIGKRVDMPKESKASKASKTPKASKSFDLTSEDREFILLVYREMEETRHKCWVGSRYDDRACILFPKYVSKHKEGVKLDYSKVTGLEYKDVYIQFLKEEMDYFKNKFISLYTRLSDITDEL